MVMMFVEQLLDEFEDSDEEEAAQSQIHFLPPLETTGTRHCRMLWAASIVT